MVVTALYAAGLAVLFVLLSADVVRHRWRAGKSLGDGGDKGLRAAIRVHGNFAEHVPFALVLMGVVESLQADPLWVHGLGGALVLGRLLHVWGLNRQRGPHWTRTTGVGLTWTVLLAGAGMAVFLAL